MTELILRRGAGPAPALSGVFGEVVRGLSGSPKSLPCKLFYDEAGARLFERIGETEAYYPTRTEVAILRAHAGEIADALGGRARVVELGSGSGLKTRILLSALHDPAEYLPVDISGEQLLAVAEALRGEFPALAVRPVRADYTERLLLPDPLPTTAGTVAFFPGSTLGNFLPEDAAAFLRRIAAIVGPGGRMLVGVDLKKDPARLERAYNDPEGVTAAFNLNLLAHVNRLCGGDFDLSGFSHLAFYDEARGRIEMHLLSRREQTVTLRGRRPASFVFAAGEPIVTEYSCKYDLDGFRALAAAGGFTVERVWTDPERLFSVQLLVAS